MVAMFSSWLVLRLRSTGMQILRASAAFKPASLISSGLKPLPGRSFAVWYGDYWFYVVHLFSSFFLVVAVDSCVAE